MYKVFLTAAAVVLPYAAAQEKGANPAETPAPKPTPLTQIAVRTEELTRSLREISRRLPSDRELGAFDQSLRAQEELVANRLERSNDTLTSGATLVEISEQAREWRTYSTGEAQQRKTLNDWGTACEQNLQVLNNERLVWESTLTTINSQEQFTSLVGPIQAAITEIQALKAVADQRLQVVLDLQTRVSKQALLIADIIEKLTTARQHFRSRMFYADAPPLWRAIPQGEAESVSAILTRSIARFSLDCVQFVSTEEGVLAKIAIFVVFIVLITRRTRREMLSAQPPDQAVARAALILKRPFLLAALIGAPVLALSSPPARMTVVLLIVIIFVIPVSRLLPFYTSSPRIIYFLAGFYALNGLAGIADIDLVGRRWLLAIVFATAITVLLWWGRPARLYRLRPMEEKLPRDLVLVRWMIGFMVPILVANVLGFVLLGYLLRLIFLLCSCFALVLYTFVRVMTTLVTGTLRLPRLRSLMSVQLYEAALVRWTERLLKAAAAGCWIYVTLSLLELREPTQRAFQAVLNARPGLRAFNFSLGDVLGFVSVIVVGYLIASALRFILREEALRRCRLARGVPETISTSLYYVLLVLVFLMSLNAAGVKLDKLTVLTGAFGVGLGFGMQNIVNNFVSGLILHYGRPIRVGDVLEVGTLSGEVRRIGIRASTMRTFQGAEVIIPNSTFVAGQVVNWTLSEPVRRVDVPVRVAYGTDPQYMIKMLLDIANGHAEVLRVPEPCAVFMGFGESALEFLLMFWANQDTHFRLRSEISISVSARLRDAGIEIPVPQREIRVHSPDSRPAFKQSA